MIRTGRWFLIAVLFLAGCASQQTRVTQLRPSESVTTNRVEPQAKTLYFQAERAFLAKDYEKAIRGYQAVRSKFPNARNAAILSTYRLGTIYYYQEEYAAAAREFDGFLQRYPGSELTFDVRYNLAACEYTLGNYERAYKTLSAFKLSEIRGQGTRRAEVVYQLAGLSAEAVNNHSAAIVAYAAEAQLPLDERRREQILAKVDPHLAQITATGQLDRLLSEVSEPVIRGKITQRMNQLAAASTTPAVAEGQPQTDASGLPLQGGSRADRLNIGVILPLTGNMARYGERALEGILLAAGTFQNNRDFDFKLYIEDSQSNPEVAKRAVDTLYNRDNVLAILGPLSWNEAVAVADRAQQLGVLNLSLTGKEGVSSRGAYLFQNALTPRVQLESLVTHCMKDKNFKRFAILAPNNAFGKDMSSEFWELVEKNGGRIVGYRLYPPDEKDFQDYVAHLVGRADPAKFRSMEVAKLAEFKKETKEKTGREPKSDIPSIVDFDAIFLPDSPATVAQIAASLAYYDVDGVPLLGTTEWNTDQLYKRGGRYVEGAIFPGGLSSTTKNETQKNFIRNFATAYGNPPDLLATQAFEAMYILTGSLKSTSSSDRNEIVKEMSQMSGFATPLGSITFDSTRIARRQLSVFKLETGGAIVEQ